MLCLGLSSGVSAQYGYYHDLKVNYQKYFVSLGYGIGTARWYSTLISTAIYDKNGAVLQSGDIDFRARNSTNFYDFNVMFPIQKVRYGLGICFEKFYLDKLQLLRTVNSSNGTGVSGDQILLFDESFRFDKVYAQVEVPFWPESKSLLSLSANMHAGYFSFNGVDRINFFGRDALARSMFIAISPVGDVRIVPHTYLFIQPMFEYKYFKSQALDASGIIKHNIISYSMLGGLRVDVSRE